MGRLAQESPIRYVSQYIAVYACTYRVPSAASSWAMALRVTGPHKVVIVGLILSEVLADTTTTE